MNKIEELIRKYKQQNDFRVSESIYTRSTAKLFFQIFDLFRDIAWMQLTQSLDPLCESVLRGCVFCILLLHGAICRGSSGLFKPGMRVFGKNCETAQFRPWRINATCRAG